MSGCWYAYPSEKYEFAVGMMTFPPEWNNNPFMFQTTNQIIYVDKPYSWIKKTVVIVDKPHIHGTSIDLLFYMDKP